MPVSNETLDLFSHVVPFSHVVEGYNISAEDFGSLVTQWVNVASTVDAEPAVDDFKPASMRKLKRLYE